MSTNYFRVCPQDPYFLPAPDRQEAALELFRTFVAAPDEVTMESSDLPQFIHGWGNWEGVVCPKCGTPLDEWWSDAMDQAGDSEAGDFTNLNCTTPRCGTRTTLNDLAYISPVGFARFVMDAPDPGRPDLEPEEMAELEELLGCRLRLVWGHI